jgi:hypothetical protein
LAQVFERKIMAHQTGSGTTLGISLTAPSAHTEAGFDALSFATVGEVTNIGEFGKEFALVTHSPLSTRGVKKGKGSYNNGNVTPSLALDTQDAGQTAMKQALESDDPAYFIVTLQNGTIYYFEALVMSFKPNVSTNDDVVTASPNLEITDKKVLEKAVS